MGPSTHEINVKAVFEALGPIKAAALPGLHALSDADITGTFAGKSKTLFWNRFLDAPDEVLRALTCLGKMMRLYLIHINRWIILYVQYIRYHDYTLEIYAT